MKMEKKTLGLTQLNQAQTRPSQVGNGTQRGPLDLATLPWLTASPTVIASVSMNPKGQTTLMGPHTSSLLDSGLHSSIFIFLSSGLVVGKR